MSSQHLKLIMGSGGGVAGGWWLSGDISAANCIAAYQSKGVASYAASKINLNDPGTNDATEGGAPSWASGTGWTFNGSSQYLKTGVIPANDQTWSVLVRVVTGTLHQRVFGCNAGGSPYFLLHTNFASQVRYLYGGTLTASPDYTTGTIGWAGNTPYRGGVVDSGTIPSAAGVFPEIYLGAINSAGVTKYNFNGSILAWAIYDTILDAAQMLAVTTEMEAL